jgi:hypothetical protein
MGEKDQLIFEISACPAKPLNSLKGIISRIVNKMVSSARLSLEQVELRPNTITELGHVIATLRAVIHVIKGIQRGLFFMVPRQTTHSEISDLLKSLMAGLAKYPAQN